MVKQLTVATLLLAIAVPGLAQRRRAASPTPPCTSAVLATAAVSEIAAAGGSIYYTDWETRAVWRVGARGGTPQILAAFPGFVPVLIATDGNLVYTFVRPHGGNASFRDPYTLFAIPAGGGTPSTLAEGVPNPKALVVDDRYVYWASYGTLATDPYVNSDGRVERVAKDGSGRFAIATNLSGAYSLALDDQFVYFVETGLAIGNTSAGVRRVSKAGGAITRLYDGDAAHVLVDGNDLLLLTENYDRLLTEIRRMPKSGGTPRLIVSDRLATPSFMNILDGRLYYPTIRNEAEIVSVAAADGRDRVVHFEAVINSDNIVVDQCAIYVATVEPDRFLLRRIAK